MLKHRLISGLLLGALTIAVVLWLPPWPALALLVGVGVWLQRECYALLSGPDVRPLTLWGLVIGAAWVAAAGAWAVTGERCLLVFSSLSVLLLALLFGSLFFLPSDARSLQRFGITLIGFMYIPVLLAFMGLLALGMPDGRRLFLFMVAVVKLGDVGAYAVGCAIGRHKLVPRISPAKTWEGLFGGLALSLLAALGMRALLQAFGALEPLTVTGALVLGALLYSAGVFGDLIESALKRAAHVKDSSQAIQGMGGLLDVIDSLLWAAPVMLLYTFWFLIGR